MKLSTLVDAVDVLERRELLDDAGITEVQAKAATDADDHAEIAKIFQKGIIYLTPLVSGSNLRLS